MSNHLQNRNGTYYFRRVVPDDLRGYFFTGNGKPRTEWTWSLRVKDREAAKRLLPECLAKTNELIDEARESKSSAPSVGAMHVASEDAEREAGALRDALDAASSEAADFFADHYADEDHKAANDPIYALDMEIRAQKALELRRLREKEEARVLLSEAEKTNQLSLKELFENYAAVPGRSPKTIAQWRPYVSSLIEFIGHDSAGSLTTKELIGWRNHLRDNVRYRGRRLAAKTINGSYLGALSTLLSWAVGDGLIDQNPMSGVSKVKVPATPQLRPKEFSADEARTILSATLLPISGAAGDDWRNAVRWIPWLMAYSGARVNEITQLRKEDITTADEKPVMRLTPDAGPIKNRQARIVPLHSHILDQGFLDFVELRKEGPLFYDPTRRRKEGALNRQPSRLGSRLAAWVRSLGISGVRPNHAWRHLFNTLSNEHGMDQRSTFAILGHSAGNVNQAYGSVPVSRLAVEIEKLPRFEVAL